MITTQPQLSSQLLCRCCPGWAGLRLLPGVAQRLAACPCTGDVSVRGDTWVCWEHCIMSKQCHNTSHCHGKCGHVTQTRDMWHAQYGHKSGHLGHQHQATPDTSTPLKRWRMTHPPITYRQRLSTRVHFQIPWFPFWWPSSVIVCKILCIYATLSWLTLRQRKSQGVTNIFSIMIYAEAKEKSGGDKHIMILCNIWCTLCSLMNLINCMTGEHDWHSLDSGKLKRQKPLTVQHVITNSCVV